MIKTKFLGSSSSGVFCVDGVDLFQYQWKTTGKCAVVLEPENKKAHTFSVYEITVKEDLFQFVAGEWKPGVWGLYSIIK